MSDRILLINTWLEKILGDDNFNITRLTGDASFRTYYRITCTDTTYILMDSPPSIECSKNFIVIDNFLRIQKIHAPKIFHKDTENGLLLLEDFGDELLLNILSPKNADLYYQQAIDIICDMQNSLVDNALNIPSFNKTIISNELALFRDWFLDKLLTYELCQKENAIIEHFFDDLTHQVLKQKTTFVHRDFHSRNLMRLKTDALGVLDFQDAVIGPLTYDLVSLLKDAYIAWPREKQEKWLNYYYDKVSTLGLVSNYDIEQLFRDYEITGLQRHIKVVGIFARLFKRDGKSRYLQDIPRVMNYIIDAMTRIDDYHEFYSLMAEKFIPYFEQKNYTGET